MSHNAVRIGITFNRAMLAYRPLIIAHVGLSGQGKVGIGFRSVDTNIATRQGRSRRLVHHDGLGGGSRVGTTMLVLVVYRNDLRASRIPLQGDRTVGGSTATD